MSASLFLALYAIYGITAANDEDFVDANSMTSQQWFDDDGVTWKVADEGNNADDRDDIHKDIILTRGNRLTRQFGQDPESIFKTDNAAEIMEQDDILNVDNGDNDQDKDDGLEQISAEEENDDDIQEINGHLEMDDFGTKEYDDEWDNDQEWDEISTLYSAQGDVIRRKCLKIWRGKLCLCQFLGWIDNNYVDHQKYHCIYHDHTDQKYREYQQKIPQQQEHENREYEHRQYETIPVHHIQIHHFHHVASSDEPHKIHQPQQIQIAHIHNPRQIIIGPGNSKHGQQFEIKGHLKETHGQYAEAHIDDNYEDDIDDDDDEDEDDDEDVEQFENYLNNALEKVYSEAFLRGYRAGIDRNMKQRQKHKMQPEN